MTAFPDITQDKIDVGSATRTSSKKGRLTKLSEYIIETRPTRFAVQYVSIPREFFLHNKKQTQITYSNIFMNDNLSRILFLICSVKLVTMCIFTVL